MMTSTIALVTYAVTMATLGIIDAAQPDYCTLPAVTGICRAAFTRFYYDTATGECKTFIYGGCRGNLNNFVTESQCKAACVCTMDSNRGRNCRRRRPRRFYYDVETKTCNSLRYGGCGGNGNRFNSLGSCLDTCETSFCFLPREIGPCRAAIPRFYYNSTSGTCEAFTYGGCGGNNNRFTTETECISLCQAPIKLQQDTELGTSSGGNGEGEVDICQLPQKTGPCRAAFRRFFYNSNTQTCEPFVYGGCEGNANNFATAAECNSRCGQPKIRSSSRRRYYSSRTRREVGVTAEDCQLPPDAGPCKAYMPRFYYNGATGRCEELIYGGCRGNKNRFPTEQSCLDACKQFDQKAFTSIIGGGLQRTSSSKNPNIFDIINNNIRSLLGLPPLVYENNGAMDARSKSQPVVQMIGALEDTPYNKPVCGLPKDPGNCRARIDKFFFNKETLQCELFVYGGCGGNGNQFESKSWCETVCKKTTMNASKEKCLLPPETGMCRAYFKMFHYNATSGLCEDFVYGGCGGNENKFETVEECKKSCDGVQ